MFCASSPAVPQDSATPRLEAVALLREVARAVELYLLAHVVDDIGEATVRGALESVGAVGDATDQVKPHRQVIILRIRACTLL